MENTAGPWIASILLGACAAGVAWFNYHLDWWWLILIAAIVTALCWAGVAIIVWIDE